MFSNMNHWGTIAFSLLVFVSRVQVKIALIIMQNFANSFSKYLCI